MFFLDKSELEKKIRLLRKDLLIRGISEELRGWSYDQPPVEPSSKPLLRG